MRRFESRLSSWPCAPEWRVAPTTTIPHHRPSGWPFQIGRVLNQWSGTGIRLCQSLPPLYKAISYWSKGKSQIGWNLTGVQKRNTLRRDSGEKKKTFSNGYTEIVAHSSSFPTASDLYHACWLKIRQPHLLFFLYAQKFGVFPPSDRTEELLLLSLHTASIEETQVTMQHVRGSNRCWLSGNGGNTGNDAAKKKKKEEKKDKATDTLRCSQHSVAPSHLSDTNTVVSSRRQLNRCPS